VLFGISNVNATLFGTFRGGNVSLTEGSYVVSRWTNGAPMISVKDEVGPNNHSRVDLGFWPNRNTLYGEPEIYHIEINALLYAAGQLPLYFGVENVADCVVPNVTAVMKRKF